MMIKTLIFIWKMWFFLVVLVTTLTAMFLAFPFYLFLGKYSYYPMTLCARFWGKSTLILSGVFWRVSSDSFDLKRLKGSAVFVGNHTSIIDIFLFLAVIPKPVMFIGKKALAKFPLFGMFYRAVNILVDRKDPSSRRLALDKARFFMREKGRSFAIFPEGGIPKYKTRLAPFKSGPFILALESGAPLVPITLDRPYRFVSYTFLSGRPGLVGVHIHPPVETSSHTVEDKDEIKKTIRDVIDQKLIEFETR